MLELIVDLGREAAVALAAHLGSSSGLPVELPVVRAGKPEFGDLQIAACLQLGKLHTRPPRELAEVVARGLAAHAALSRVEVAGPGFVNLHLKNEWLAARVSSRLADPGLGLRAIGAGQRVVLDYSSPNVAKPMHIGHIRSTIIGAALYRSLSALGYEVIGDNHLGDWGTQFGKLLVAFHRWLDAAAFAAQPVDELLRLYIRYQDEEKRQWEALGGKPTRKGDEDEAPTTDEPATGRDEPRVPEVLMAARAELVKLQQGDPERTALWRRFIDVSMAEFERIYRRLGVSFDVVHGESFYNDRLAATVDELLRRGIAEPSQGALVVLFTRARDGEELPPFIVKKGDGGFNYATTDVAGLLYRSERWRPARILIVTDERQQLHFRQLFATGRRLGLSASLEHVWFGLMRLPEGTFSTRDGNVIGLEALLDEAERRATVAAGAHNPELSDEERREVGRVVGLGAVKYNDLSKDRQTLVTFTWDKALALQGNTAPYLQYAYARIRSILRKASQPHEGVAGEVPLHLDSTVERDLAKRILQFPEAVEQVGRTAKPHLLCDYLYELATTFSAFYNEQPVLKAEPHLRASRLVLTEITARVLKTGLHLLGIEVLDRM